MVGHFGGAPVGGADKTKIVLLMFVFFLMLVVFAAFIYVSKNSSNIVQVTPGTQEDQRNVKILYPLRRINRDSALDPSMFLAKEMDRDAVPEGALTDPATIIGKFAKYDIIPVEGQPLMSDFVTHVRPLAIIGLIKPGFRLVTIRVDTTTGVEGWASPGAKVDVLWLSRNDGDNKVVTLVENAEVISADRKTDNSRVGETVPATVTLQVQEEDAKRITLAQSSGSLNLVLRGSTDDVSVDTKSISIEGLDRSRVLQPERVERPVAPACEGSVIVDGKKYCVIHGKMVPVDE